MDKSKEQKNDNVSRRGFIKKAAAATAGVAGASAAAKAAQASVVKNIMPASVMGANEKILTGHIGTGGMGRSHLGFAMRRVKQQMKDDIEPIALCDLSPQVVDGAAQMAGSVFKRFTKHQDFREVIDNKDVDAVVIATSDHWHCLCTLYAADAGKDIYCEKPLSTTIVEGNAMVEAVNRNKVVFQGGTMQRSGPWFAEAVELVKSGYIGKVARIETFNHEPENLEGIGIGETDLSKFPGFDWEFYQGWVERKPFNKNRWLYEFRWFLDYSGGKITDWGAHLVDIALWAKGEDVQPKSVVAMGDKFLLQDDRTTPDTLDVVWRYDDFVLSFSNRVYNGYLPQGYRNHGILFHGTNGTILVDRGGYKVMSIPNNGGCEPKVVAGYNEDYMMNLNHYDDFIDCIHSREKTIVPVETLNNTTRTCHMGTCAYVAGGMLHWDPAQQKFAGGDPEVTKKGNDWAYREYQNGWKLEAPYDRRA